MSQVTVGHTTVTLPRKAIGRPRDEVNPEKRRAQWRLCYFVESGQLTVDEGARSGKVARWTFERWVRQFRRSDDPLAIDLREKLRSGDY